MNHKAHKGHEATLGLFLVLSDFVVLEEVLHRGTQA